VAQRGFAATTLIMWDRLITCGRLAIGLPKLSRNQQQADFQSAAGCHPALQTKVWNRLEKIMVSTGILAFGILVLKILSDEAFK